jgi:hypothetical protein
MDAEIFKRIFLEQKRTKGFHAPENLFLVLNYLIANYGTVIPRASLRRQIKARWRIDKRENTVRASVQDLHKIGLVTLSTDRPVLASLDLHKFVLLLTHYYVKTSDRKIFTEILKRLMPSYGHFLANKQAFEKNSLREFYLYVDPFPLEWIIQTIKRRSITEPIRQVMQAVMKRQIQTAIIALVFTGLLYLVSPSLGSIVALVLASTLTLALTCMRRS